MEQLSQQPINTVLTVTPNPAIDFMLTAKNWQRGEVNKGQSSYTKAGGKGINVATALAQLNVQEQNNVRIIASGWLGQNNESAFVEHFDKNSIEDVFVRVNGDTRTNIKITDGSDDNNGDTTDINFSGLTITQPLISELDTKVHQILTDNTLCVLAGSLPDGVEDNFYSQMIPLLRKNGHSVIVDTSGASLQSIITTQNFPHVMKPNIHELRAVSGLALSTEKEIIDLAHTWFAYGLELLVVSLGDAGALFISKTATIKSTPPKVTVVSTVGAGDAMVSGIAYGLIQKLPLLEISRLATALSVAKITVVEKDLTLSAYVQQLLSKVVVESV